MRKTLWMMIVFVVMLSAFLVWYKLSRPKNVLKYNGVQIYDAIRAYHSLSFHGFSITTTVIGKDYSGDVKLEGVITETETGSFVLRTKRGYRTVEGPMGTQDVRAEEILFETSSPISVEAGYPPVNESEKFLELARKFERFKGEIAVNTVNPMTPVFVQRIRNLDKKFYEPPTLEVEAFGSGFILETGVPIETKDLIKILEEIDKELKINRLESSYLLFYVGANGDVDEIRERLQEDGALVRTYRAEQV